MAREDVAGYDIYAEQISSIFQNNLHVLENVIDAHFHANTPNYDFYSSDKYPKNYIAFHAHNILNDTLFRGFTTVRDAGGGDIDKGAEAMQNMMDNLEAGGMISEESQGKENPAQAMFDQAQMLEGRLE